MILKRNIRIRDAGDRHYSKIKSEESKATKPLRKKMKDHNYHRNKAWNKALAVRGQIKKKGEQRLFFYFKKAREGVIFEQ